MMAQDGDRSPRGAALLPALLIAIALPLAASRPAHAAPLVYEPFVYSAGTVLHGVTATGTNLTGTYASYAINPTPEQTITVRSPGLGFGNLVGAPAATGNRISDVFDGVAAAATVSVAQPVSVGSGETIFFSALFTFDDSQNDNHLANIALGDDSTGDLIVFGQGSIGTRNVYIGVDTPTAFTTNEVDNAFSDGDTLFLIGRYFNSAAMGGDTLDLVGYDTADAVTLPSSFDPTDPNASLSLGLSNLDVNLPTVNSITFSIRGLDNNFIDELRIGRTYADVVPEPTMTALLVTCLSAVGLSAWGRRWRAGAPR
jgi:hypothetical protein